MRPPQILGVGLAACLAAACRFDGRGVVNSDVDASGPVDAAPPCGPCIVPSNGVSRDELEAVTVGLTVANGHVVTIDTDDGGIVDQDGDDPTTTVRAIG